MMYYRKFLVLLMVICFVLSLSGMAISAPLGPEGPDLGEFNGFYTQKNKGTKSMIWGKAPAGVPYTTLQHLVEGMNKVIGRTEFLALEMERKGVQLVVIPDNMNIYDVPEWSHLKSQNNDGFIRICIPGTLETPIIVTRESDVLRKRALGAYNPDRYEFFYHFAKLFLEIGVKSGAMKTPMANVEPRDTYNYYKRLREAFVNAKKNDLWPGTKMMDSVEEYFAEGSMIYFEVTPESFNGTWTRDAGPIGRRKEMLVYDKLLFDCMVEIYGEYEYITPYLQGNNPGPVPGNQMPEDDANYKPWYMNNQVDRFGIDGKSLPPIEIIEANLISANQINIVFNRDPHSDYDYFKSNTDVGVLRRAASYKVSWKKPDGTVVEGTPGYQRFMYKTASLSLPANLGITQAAGLYDGAIGTQFQGFDAIELTDLKEKHPYMARDTGAVANPYAIKRGEYIDASRQAKSINGTLTVEILPDIQDWSGNKLAVKSAVVNINSWFGQVYRAPASGVYIYADGPVKKESIEMAGRYIDGIFANPNYGHRLSNAFTRENRGLSIVAYRNSAYQQPQLLGSYNGNNEHQYLYAEGFGGGIAQSSESGVWRDKRVTRYKHEWLLAHEFGHSTDSSFNRYCSAAELAADGLNPMNRGLGLQDLKQAVWREGLENGFFTDTYMGGWENGVNMNRHSEYISTGNTIWFSCMRESTDGSNNGTWGAINTREELYRYYPLCFEFFKTCYYSGFSTDNDVIKYEKNFIGTPWESYTNSNIYDIDGKQYHWTIPAPMLTGTQKNVFRTINVATSRNLSGSTNEEKQAEINRFITDIGNLSAGSLMDSNNGFVVVKPEIVNAIADRMDIKTDRIVTLPIVHAIFGMKGGSVGGNEVFPTAGDVMAFTIDVNGSELLATKTENILLMSVISDSIGSFFDYAGKPEEFGDKTFTLLDINGNIVKGSIEKNEAYQLLMMVKDGGEFDLDTVTDSVVVSAFALINKIVPGHWHKPELEGCNAGYYLPFVFVAFFRYLLRRKESKKL